MCIQKLEILDLSAFQIKGRGQFVFVSMVPTLGKRKFWKYGLIL